MSGGNVMGHINQLDLLVFSTARPALRLVEGRVPFLHTALRKAQGERSS